ncbi:SixA phosphatase family protein [Hydrogenophaga sp. OTU3427]|uniref:SixA phosphatase family protein n=1 Tax=Hydrogenophaga sp. OTU3427 TaxID=3043856 RepID=UPI00313AA5A9
MDLILWRHAEAEDDFELGGDLARRLTGKGEKQAARMAAWLDRQLPDGARIYASPAVRTEQTVVTLGRKYRLKDELAPHGTPDQLLQLVQWPDAKGATLVVGHQPALGRVIAQLLGLSETECAVRKGALWWLRRRERDGVPQTVVVTVQTPELL